MLLNPNTTVFHAIIYPFFHLVFVFVIFIYKNLDLKSLKVKAKFDKEPFQNLIVHIDPHSTMMKYSTVYIVNDETASNYSSKYQ